MAFLLVIIVIHFVIFLVVCGIVLPLRDVIGQFRRHRPVPEPPPPMNVQGTGSAFSWLCPAGVSAQPADGVADHSGRHAPQQPP